MNNVTSNDLVFAISHSGQTYEIIKSVEVAKEHGAKIISLTKVASNPLTQLSDIAIKTVAENINFRLTAISSTITQLTVIDIIFILLNKIDYEKNMNLAKKNREIVEMLKIKK
jgi:RpiR family murPQ operon transcriptional repressor